MKADVDQPRRRRVETEDKSIVVVIPYYNGSKYIERAVQSVLKQSVAATELVIVNDGSKAEEADFLRALAETYPFRIIDKENGGQGSARNAGVAASTSRYICFLDQDDYYLEHHNEVLLNAIPANDVRFGWVYADLYEADSEGRVVTTTLVKHHGTHPKTSLFDLIRTDMHVLPSASLISRVAFEAVGGFDEQFTGYEDDDLFMRLFRARYSNTFIPTSVTAWCMHTESTSYSIRMCRSRMRFFKKMVQEFPDDWGKGRFYLRDMLIPRFHDSFVGDTLMSFFRHENNNISIYDNRSELISILEDYRDIIYKNDSIPKRDKLRLSALLAIVKTDNTFLIKTAVKAMGFARKFLPSRWRR